MKKALAYSIKPATDISPIGKGYLIYDDQQQLMQNHIGSVYPSLPKNVAQILANDINEIITKDTFLRKGKIREKLSPEEVTHQPNFRLIRQEQERMSFSVCVQNTHMAIENEPDFSIQLDKLIQWDFLYRMSPGPKEKMKQVIASKQAIRWLGKDWKDLQGNYAGSLEEMEELEIPFVSQILIDRLKIELESMNLEEKVAVWFLYEFFERFSITMPILWVKGIIRSVDLENSYYSLSSDSSMEEVQKIRTEEGDFVQRRLSYLKKYLNALKLTLKKQKIPCAGY